MSNADAFHLLLLDILFIAILVISYFYSNGILLSPGTGGIFDVTPLLLLFGLGLLIALIIFIVLFYILVHNHDHDSIS